MDLTQTVQPLHYVGEVAQLARASALHAEGHGFDSLLLHTIVDIDDKLNYRLY